MYDILASIKPSDVLKADIPGQIVNSHEVQAQKEPEPDFDNMRRTLHGDKEERQREKSGSK